MLFAHLWLVGLAARAHVRAITWYTHNINSAHAYTYAWCLPSSSHNIIHCSYAYALLCASCSASRSLALISLSRGVQVQLVVAD